MKWEYKTVKIDITMFNDTGVRLPEIDEFTNQLGKAGWELVAPVNRIDYLMGQYPRTQEIILFFKRPINDSE